MTKLFVEQPLAPPTSSVVQVSSLMQALCLPSASLTYLDLRETVLTSVSPALLAAAVNSLQTALLASCSLTVQQCSAILIQVKEDDIGGHSLLVSF